MSESNAAAANVEEPIGEIVERPIVAPEPEGGDETAPEQDLASEPDGGDEPGLDAKDQQIANLERMVDFMQRAGPREPAPRQEPKPESLRDMAVRLGFGNVGATEDRPGVNMVEPLMQLFEAQKREVGAIVEPRLNDLQQDVVGTKFQRSLAVRVQKQSPDFLRFAEAEMNRDATLRVLSVNPHGAEAAAELLAGRWNAQRKAVKQGEDRRQERLSGAALQSGASRGGNGTELRLTVRRGDPDLGHKLNEYERRGGKPENVKFIR